MDGLHGPVRLHDAFEQTPEGKTSRVVALAVPGTRPRLRQALGLAIADRSGNWCFRCSPRSWSIEVDEQYLGLLNILVLGMLARVHDRATGSGRSGYARFVAVRLDSATLDHLTRRLLSLPMSYFTTRRTGDIQRRLDGARTFASSSCNMASPRYWRW